MKRAQTVLEYAYLIGIVALAIVALSVYIKRGFEGRLRVQADQLGEQYSPGHMRTNINQFTVVDYHDTARDKDGHSDSWSNTTTQTRTAEQYNPRTKTWRPWKRSYERTDALKNE